MSLEALRETARGIVDQLARGDYELVVQQCAKSHLTGDDLGTAIRDYGRKLVSPPKDAYNNLDAVQVRDGAVPTWSIRAPLYTQDEGRSDLTVELTVALCPGKPSVELDDLHVL